MQFTKTLLRPLFSLMVVLSSMLQSDAQTTISTNFTNNNGSALVTFNFRNNNTTPVLITDMASITGTTGDKIVSVFYKTTPIAGSPGNISAANGWLLAATATPNITTASAVVPMISNVNLVVPAGATYGIAFQVTTSAGAGSLRYSTITAGPFTFSGGGCDLLNGANISYGGGVAPATPTNSPRGFIGSVTFIPYTTCSSLPAPGNTISSVTTACANVPFNLSLQNGTPQAGLSYQWQQASSATGPWSDISGATGSTYTATQTSATFYRCNVTCAGSGAASSSPVLVNMNIPTNCYCDAAASLTVGEKIARVRYNQIDNTSNSTAGYENFLNVTTPAYLGTTSQITINISGGFSSDQSFVWIDFNQNGSFSDPGEQVFTSATSAGPHVGNITIPSTAMMGNTRMRVRMHDSAISPNNTPCGVSSYGQVEDYTVNIQVCIPATFTTQPSSTSVSCGGNASFSVAASGSAPVYGWQFRASATAAWQDVTNTGIYSGATTNTLVLTNVPGSFNGYQYRALLTGACAALDNSQAATLTVSQLVPAVSPSSATICTGSIQALSLTNTLSNTDLISESFNNIPGLIAAGWSTSNLSSPLGPATGWGQGTTTAFSAYSGAGNSYVAANYQSTGTLGTISNWLLTPSVAIKNGDQLKFWTRTLSGLYPDRLEIRMSTNGTSTNVGTSATSVGDFSTLLLTVNPSLTTTGYPTVWTQYTATVSGLTAPVTGRFAFRYFVTGGGSSGANSDYIGVDDVVFTSVGALAQGVWTSSPAAPNTMFADAAGTIPYTGAPVTTIYVKPTANTSYSVSYTTPTPCQSGVTTVPVAVSQPVTGLIVSPAARAVCVGGSTSFTATVTSGGTLTYQWAVSTNGGGTYTNISGATGATLNLTGVTQSMNGNLYRVTATAGPCGSVTSTVVGRLTVNALPVVTLAAPMVKLVPGRTTTLTVSSNPPAASNGYAWTLNGNPIAGTGNTQIANIDRLGTYQATVTDLNGCVNKSNPLTIFAEGSDRVWIYPNPTSGAFQVRLYHSGERAEKRVVTIYNTIGLVIESKEFVLVAGSPAYYQMSFDLSGGATAKGAYVVKVAELYSGRVVSGLVMLQ